MLRVGDEHGTTDADATKKIPLLRHFTVFNRGQIDGLPTAREAQDIRHPCERDEAVEAFVAASGARVIEGGSFAYYSPAGVGEIHMPPLEVFTSREAYYGTELHELTHWTGHPSRLNRDHSGAFGSEPYAREELVAEMGAAFLCAALGVEGRIQHPEYIGSWIKGLRDDKRAIFRAASEARQAAKYLGAIPPVGQQDDEEEREGAAEMAEAA
jgi:antirestriction protein ArdC